MHHFSFPTPIVFGAGARFEAAKTLAEAGAHRPLVVTDSGVAGLPTTAQFLEALSASGLAVSLFSGVRGNPKASQVVAGADAYRAHNADAVVGLGGGAALDVAKAVALMAVHPGEILEYAWDHPSKRAITQKLPFLLALPTTSGTGSEVGRSAVISSDETHAKRIVFSPALLAAKVLADPELTLGLSPAITAATGIDALTHNIESYLSNAYHPICDGVAAEGARIAARALSKAVHDGGNLAARSDMMMASIMGGIAFQKDLGAVHSCAHALSAVADTHHGLANALMIDHVLMFNLAACPKKMADLAIVMEVGDNGEDLIHWLSALRVDVGIPPTLSSVGIRADQIPALARYALGDPCHATNPRACTLDDFERLFQAAL